MKGYTPHLELAENEASFFEDALLILLKDKKSMTFEFTDKHYAIWIDDRGFLKYGIRDDEVY